MTAFQAVFYGLIQGLTEFLPVSSSAHLVLLPWFTGWPDPGLAFDVALHWGTLFAAVAYFRLDIVEFLRSFGRSLIGVRNYQTRLPWQIIAATVPGAVFGIVFEKQADTVFRSPLLIAGTLSGLGVILYAADRWGANHTPLSGLSWFQAVAIGFSQGLAIVPGISRSVITISTALLLGVEKTAAVKFSFYLAMPIIFGAGLLKAGYLLANAAEPALWIGLGTATLSGFLAIHLLLTYVKTRSFTPFVIYRFALALLILMDLGK